MRVGTPPAFPLGKLSFQPSSSDPNALTTGASTSRERSGLRGWSRVVLGRGARSAAVRDSLREDMRLALLDRLGGVMMAAAVSMPLSLVVDVGVAPGERYLRMVVKLAIGLAYVAGVLLLHRLRSARAALVEQVVPFVAGLMCVGTTAPGLVADDAMMIAYLLSVVTIGVAVVLPWSVRAQLVLLGIAVACFALTLVASPSGEALSPDMRFAVLTAMFVSVVAAYALEAHREETHRIALLHAGQAAILRRVSADADLSEVLGRIVDLCEEQFPRRIFSVLLLDEDRRRLRHGASGRLPAEWVAAIDGVEIGPDVGSCGAAAARAERVVVANVATDSKWTAYRDLALSHQLHACWSEPIRDARGEVLGTFATYSNEPAHPGPAEITLVETAADLAGIAIERQRGHEAIRKYLTALDAARREAVRQAGELPIARDEALASTRAKSEFLANMSHEIRTPMNAVIGMTTMLLGTPLTDDRRDFAQTIRMSGDALLSVIDDILDFSKIEAGQVELEKHPFEPRVCAEDSIDLIAQHAAEKGVEVTLLIGRHVPRRVVGDPSRLRQVLVNLLNNAVKFTDAGDVTLGCWAVPGEEDRIHFAVRDTGVGIPQERISRLFRPFTQGDASVTRRFGGTGLGLTISERFVEMMGGDMSVESEPGRGSTFFFTIRAPAEAAQRDAAPEAPALAGRTVRVADPHATRHLGLALQAEALGLDASTVDGAGQAVARVRAGERFDVVIRAATALTGDEHAAGIDLLRAAGERAIPVLLVGAPGRDSLEGCPGPRVETVLRPVRSSQLATALGRLLDGGTRASARARQASDSLDTSLGSRLPLRVLLAEDNRIDQRAALTLLERMGYRADVAADGFEVLAALDRQPCDLILMDIQMQGMDGNEAARTIRQGRPPHEQPAILALTANATQHDHEACLAAGMDGFLSKPVAPAALAKALDRCARARLGDVEDAAQRMSV